ncbi:MAG: ribosomal protein S18-alanine N-acetyltransferase [Elusimicrobia bacterium]|nr:ribosomal protein S18-alanine N-acetyltransferase [Elusimicrobiota bacterium]
MADVSGIIIRKAETADAAEMEKIEKTAENYPAWGAREFVKDMANRVSNMFVAEQDGKMTGFINFWIVGGQAQLNGIAVRGEMTKRGIGGLLLKKMLESAKESGCSEAVLEVEETNLPAIRLYSKFGFKKAGTRPKFYDNTGNAVLMRAEI